MKSLNSRSVVDQLATQLAARRTTSIGRRTAYVALAQAILNDPAQHLLIGAALDRQPMPIRHEVAAA
jgi:hypothetical protein